MVTSSNFVCDLGTEMTLQLAVKLQYLFSPVKQNVLPSFSGFSPRPQNQRINSEDSSLRLECSSLSSSSLNLLSWDGRSRRKRVVKVCGMVENLGRKMKGEESSDSEDDDEHDNSTERVGNDWYPVDEEERREWRRKIQEVIDQNPDIEEEVDLVEKRKKVQKLLVDYPLIVEEDDPDWPEDADGWGFNLGQFFNKITIKNVKKDDDDENYDSENEIVWQDDDYIRPIKDITAAEWEETVFKDISPLIVFVHNRYKRPKENEKVRDELEKAVHIIWSCRLPSPRCVAVDAVTEENLVSALQVSVFPELLFTKAGKILYREKAIRTADELSKIMAFFYYGAGKPTCLNGMENSQELIPNVAITVNDSKLS